MSHNPRLILVKSLSWFKVPLRVSASSGPDGFWQGQVVPTQLKKKTGLYRLVRRLAPQASFVLIIALAAGLGSLFVENASLSLGILIGGTCLGVLSISIKVLAAWYHWRQKMMIRSVSGFVEK